MHHGLVLRGIVIPLVVVIPEELILIVHFRPV